MGSDPNDASLVRLARQGDRAAFARLIERHYPALRSTCRRALGDGDLAGDAAQQATLTAMLGLERLRDDERFGSWLIGIGLNVCRTMLRRRVDRPGVIEALADDDPPTAEADPALAAEIAEVEGRVRAAIASLPRGQQEAVALFYLAGLTQAEIAERLGTAPGAIKTRLHKARRSLRASLNELWKEAYAMPTETPTLLPMHIADLRRTVGSDPDSIRNIVYLEDDVGSRRLPIWIGQAEAIALAVALEEVELPRPWTHQLTANLLQAAGGRVREVRIVELTDSIFYAQIILSDGAEVDARPSDALTLAVQLAAPIYVDHAVLDRAETLADPERSEAETARERGDDAGAIARDTQERLAREAQRYRKKGQAA
ncbi:MAG TPA: bifunctional nuclease domain-containing protein [Solirubrobacteraceae bacterium]|nr:bifunctional nuclease domain-containing protein [Solirubrobacteraceae bacterium]